MPQQTAQTLSYATAGMTPRLRHSRWAVAAVALAWIAGIAGWACAGAGPRWLAVGTLVVSLLSLFWHGFALVVIGAFRSG